MRLLQGFLVATLLSLMWLGWFAMWGMFHLTKAASLVERYLEPAWFQTFNFWASAVAWLMLVWSVTARIIRIIRAEKGKASDWERKKVLYQASRNWFMRGAESLIIVMAGCFGVLTLLAVTTYVWHVRTGYSVDRLGDLVAPLVKPLMLLSFIGYAGFAVWLLRLESTLLKAWKNCPQP